MREVWLPKPVYSSLPWICILMATLALPAEPTIVKGIFIGIAYGYAAIVLVTRFINK